MEPIYYVMAIMGCADNGATCAPVRVDPARYGSLAACQAAMPRALSTNGDIAYPVIGAHCSARGTRFANRREPAVRLPG